MTNELTRTITYYYPVSKEQSAVKVFQDRSSQIRAFYFEREYLNRISKEEHALNYGVYFLFGPQVAEGEKREIYVGLSKNGAKRIESHVRKKDFWKHCIVFVSDNNIFDTGTIDFLEHYFIHEVEKSSNYKLTNIDMRTNQPNINKFDELTYASYVSQIQFLLNAEGVVFEPKVGFNDEAECAKPVKQQKKSRSIEEAIKLFDGKIYQPKSKVDKAKKYSLLFKDGLSHLTAGSLVHKPKDKLANWSDGGFLYNQLLEKINKEESKGNLKDNGDGTLEVLNNIPFKSPSGVCRFAMGCSANGWDRMEGIEEIRSK